MKKTILALTLLFAVTLSFAAVEPKTPAEAQKYIDKALTKARDAKKSLKPATWIELGDAYVGAYDQPVRNVLLNTARTEVKLLIKDQKILSTTDEVCNGTQYIADHYENKVLYYGPNGALEFYIITKPAVEGNLLVEAENAYLKAHELDIKGSKKDELAEKMQRIHERMFNEALSHYFIGDYKYAAGIFEDAVNCSENAVINAIDSTNCYHTALVSALAGDRENAIKYYNRCAEIGFYQDGNVFSNLSNLYLAEGDTVKGKKVLEDGFAKYPQSQGVLIGLINLYRATGEDPQKLFDLLHAAQVNEPNNASLYYVEGDIYKQLGDRENAEKLFYKASEIDPNYVFGTLSVGIMYYEYAVDLQTQASEELDDTKWMALNKQFEEVLEKAIDPFEKSFTMTEDKEIKKAVAEYLKNIYFRFRDKNADYMAAYEKYNAYVKAD
jgi:tetratricopeptide (TPR) repeat protein